MEPTRDSSGRTSLVVATVCAMAAAAVLLSGCGKPEGRTQSEARGDGNPATQWDEPGDYRYTLSLFDGKCGDRSTVRGSWAITVVDGTAAEAEPLNAAARESSWPEGAPTIGALLDNALGVRADGAYDVVDIDYAGNGPHAGRPTRIHYLDRDGKSTHESCEGLHAFTPTP